MEFITFFIITSFALVLIPLMGWILIKITVSPQFALTVGLLLTTFSISQFGNSNLRLSIAFVLAPHLLSAINNSKSFPRRIYPNFHLPIIYIGVCTISILWSLSPTQTAISTSAWIILILFVFTFRILVSFQEIRKISFFILLSFFFFSLLLLPFPLGWEAGRAIGMYNNANAAGIFTFILIGLSLWMGKKYWAWVIPIGISFTFATGSRASMLAIATLLIVVLLQRIHGYLRLPVIGITLGLSLPIANWVWYQIQSVAVSDTSVFRTNNSREEAWSNAFDFIAANPYLGAGYRATPEGIGSNSYIKLYAELGFLFATIGIILAVSYLWWSRKNPVLLGLTCGTLVNTFFEDWLLTAGAPMLILYFLLLYSTPQHHPHQKLEIDSLSPLALRLERKNKSYERS